MQGLRKIVVVAETVLGDAKGGTCAPIGRVAAAGVIRNPLAGARVEDMERLFELGRALGERLTEAALARLPGPAVAYGKAALVGLDGEMEHGAAMIHPRLGAPMRAAIGGGAALIPSNCKAAVMGAAMDVPLGHKDDAWSRDHFDTMTVALADAPLPHEIVLIVAFADGGRPLPRAGTGPVRS